MPATRRSRMHRLWHGLPRLSGAVVCSGSGDVVVLSRRTWVQHSSQPDISLSRLVIRVGRITDVSSRDDPFLESCMEVTVHAGAARLEFVVPIDAAPAFAGMRSMTSG
jgi:hypothetical protein